MKSIQILGLCFFYFAIKHRGKMSKRKRNDLTLADHYEVVKLLDQKLTQTEISKRLGCSISQICRINSKEDDIRTQYESNSNPDVNARDPVKPATWKQHSQRGLSTPEPEIYLYLVQYKRRRPKT